MRCAWCDRRRKLRGSKVCDECAEDWWYQENVNTYDDGDEIEVVIDWTWESPHMPDGDHRINLICEVRWRPMTNERPWKNYVPSRLWDTKPKGSAA